MKALKKPYVAIMVMALCICLAIVIGQARQSIYEAPLAVSSSQMEETDDVTDFLYDISTYGTIRAAILDAHHDMSPESVEDTIDTEKKGISGLGAVLIIFLIIFVLSKAKNN